MEGNEIMEKIKVYLLDPNGEAKVCDIEYKKGWIKKLLCINNSFGIIEGFIGNECYDFIFDDEYLHKANYKPVACCEDNIILGKMIICRTDGKGNETSINDKDIENIELHLLKGNGIIFFENFMIQYDNLILPYSSQPNNE